MLTSERSEQGAQQPVLGRLLRVMLWVVIAVIALRAFMIVAFRTRYRPIINGVRAFNKRILNPAMMRYAGHKGWYAAVIRHSGRTSGKQYETPVLAEPTPDSFLIPLPYGEDVDWLKNVLAAGKCEIENQGLRYEGSEPHVVDREEAEPFLRSYMRRQLALYGVDRYLKVKRQIKPAPTVA